jgi:hypothetical protein
MLQPACLILWGNDPNSGHYRMVIAHLPELSRAIGEPASRQAINLTRSYTECTQNFTEKISMRLRAGVDTLANATLHAPPFVVSQYCCPVKK